MMSSKHMHAGNSLRLPNIYADAAVATKQHEQICYHVIISISKGQIILGQEGAIIHVKDPLLCGQHHFNLFCNLSSPVPPMRDKGCRVRFHYIPLFSGYEVFMRYVQKKVRASMEPFWDLKISKIYMSSILCVYPANTLQALCYLP